MIFKKIILSTLSAIGLIITASVGQSLVVTSALAIKPCPSPIHPPCCPSPCPVTDSQLRSKFSEANSNILQALELIGGGGPLTSSRSSSPISREQIQNMSWIASQKAVSLALNGARPKLSVSFNRPVIQTPEMFLPDNELPLVHGIKTNQGYFEDLADYKVDFSEAYYSPGLGTIKSIEDLRKKRSESLRSIALNSWSRSISKRSSLPMYEDEYDRLKAEFTRSVSAADDFRINSEVKAAVLSRLFESIELQSLILETNSAYNLLSKGDVYSRPGVSVASNDPSEFLNDYYTEKREAELSGKNFVTSVRRAVEEHNLFTGLIDLETTENQLLTTVTDHEARKSHRYLSENWLRSVVSPLYVNGESAYQAVLSEMNSANTTKYSSGDGRYSQGRSVAMNIVEEMFKFQPSTKYGQRLRRRDCVNSIGVPNNSSSSIGNGNGNGENVQECSEYAYKFSPNSAQGSIDGYYGGSYDAYKAEIIFSNNNNNNRDGSSGGLEEDINKQKDEVALAIQYAMEAGRRMEFWSDLRRGNSSTGSVVSAELWNEMSTNAISCFVGPLSPLNGALNNKPEFFDINHKCDHRVWSNSGENISYLELGGADQSLWMIETERRNYYASHSGRPGIDDIVQEALVWGDDLELGTSSDRAKGLAMEWQIRNAEIALRNIIDDPQNQTYVNFFKK